MATTQTDRPARSRRGLAAALTAAAAAAAMVACGGAAMAATPAHHGHTRPAAAAAAAPAPAAAAAGVKVNCAAAPSQCGYPDATNTGFPAYSKAGVPLRAVPGQVSSGPGWHYDSRGWVDVTGNGANLTYLSIPYNVDVTASNVTLNHDSITTSGTFGVSLRHTAGVTVENSTISGTNATAGRVNAAVSDVYGDSTAMTVKNDNISDFRIAINMGNGGLALGNYIHDPGYIAGDHTDGIMAGGSTVPATIKDNTVFISLGQTDASPSTPPAPASRSPTRPSRATSSPRRLRHLRRRRQQRRHLQHPHREQPLRPAVLPPQRPVRRRRLLQQHRPRQHLDRQHLGHHRPARHP